MNRGPVLEYYVGVVRKHWIQIVLVGLLVGAAGYLYHSRQVPAWEATTKLKIIRQTARRAASDISFTFEEDQVFYNTQYNLLTTQLDWANDVLDRAAYRLLVRLGGWPEDPDAVEKAVSTARELDGHALVRRIGAPGEPVEFAALDSQGAELRAAVREVRTRVVDQVWHLTPDSFLDGVKSAPIPNTYLAELSFTATDPGLAVTFANLYAELYRDVSTEERIQTLSGRVGQLQGRKEELKQKHDKLQEDQEQMTKKYPELSLGVTGNPVQQEADAISARINELEVDQILKRADEERILFLLDSRGIAVEGLDGEGAVRLGAAAGDGGGEPSARLAADTDVLGLPVVESSETVKQVRARIRGLEEQIARLRLDLTEESPQLQRARAKLAKANLELGREAGAALVRFLTSARDRRRAIAELRERLAAKRAEATDLNERYAEYVSRAERIEATRGEIEALDREILALEALEGSKEDGAGAGPLTIQNIGIERRARLADARRIRPNTMLILLLTGLAAVFLAFGAAFFVEFLDDTIKTKDDFERLVAVPDIGFIPRIAEREFERKDLAVAEKPRSGVAEAFRSVRTGILFSRKDEEVKSFLITSAGPGEGKTTVAVNLAATMAEAGRGRVLLVDADLRKPRVHVALGVPNTRGLTNCLVGNATLEETVLETEVENLYVLPAGPTPPNPAELLGGHRMGEILAEAGREFGKVVFDTPPLVAVTDTCLLAPLVDAVFLVISVGKTSWRLIARGKDALRSVGRETTGAILNNIRSRQHGYGYGYGYGYGGAYGTYGEKQEKGEG